MFRGSVPLCLWISTFYSRTILHFYVQSSFIFMRLYQFYMYSMILINFIELYYILYYTCRPILLQYKDIWVILLLQSLQHFHIRDCPSSLFNIRLCTTFKVVQTYRRTHAHARTLYMNIYHIYNIYGVCEYTTKYEYILRYFPTLNMQSPQFTATQCFKHCLLSFLLIFSR